MGLKAINPLIKAVAKKAYVAPKMEVRTLESLGLKMEQLTGDVAKFNSKEIKLDDEVFNFLPWRRGYNKLPPTGKPPVYTLESKTATENFMEKGWIEEPLPNGFRMPFGPYRAFDENGMIKPHMIRTGSDREFLYLNKNSKGINLMVERLKKIFNKNPNITEEEKAKILHKFVDSCYDKNRYSWIHEFSSDFIPIENTAASGAGVCRHKSFLAKVLGDRLGLHVAMARGRYIINQELGIGESHIWNEVKIGDKWFLMDIEQNRFKNLAEYSDFPKLYEYAH